MSTLTARLNSMSSKNDDVEARIAAKLATGKFQDTGKKYDADEARADANNSALRMTAVVDANGKLAWSK